MNARDHGEGVRTVSALAELAGVTVRTLHHYDEIGLLTPSMRSDAGYRLYDRGDLQRLQQIIFWRALGFTLDAIRQILDDPEYDRVAALVDQRALLSAHNDALTAMVKAVDDALAEAEGGPTVADEAMFKHFDNPEYAREAEERWGDTDAWAQSQARMKSRTPDDMKRIAEEGVAHAKRMADAMQRGVVADSTEAMGLAEEARLSIHTNFYDCPTEMHVQLGEMYVTDARFTEYYDQHGSGLAVWFCDAIVANAER